MKFSDSDVSALKSVNLARSFLKVSQRVSAKFRSKKFPRTSERRWLTTVSLLVLRVGGSGGPYQVQALFSPRGSVFWEF